MPDRTRANCQRCKRHRSECGGISWTGLCLDCGRFLMQENIDQMHSLTGPNFDLWRRRMAASVGAELLDNAPGDGHTRH